MIKVNFDQMQINNITSVMKRIEKRGKLIGNELVKETSLAFIKSATVATPPGRAGFIGGAKKTKLPKKSVYRKVVTISGKSQKNSKVVWYYDLKRGQMFGKPIAKRFTAREADRRNLILVTKFTEHIDTKTGKKFYKPIPPTQENKRAKGRFIKSAGAGKAGWLGARAKILRKYGNDSKGISRRVNNTRIKRGWNPYIEMTNNVQYMTKIAPGSARRGLGNASRVMERRFLPKKDRELQSVIKARRDFL
jgi:hypothetical protein